MNKTQKHYKYLWLLISLYVLATIVSDLAEGKVTTVLWIHAGAGLFIFTFSYFFIDIITEVYGYKRGRLTIWIGIFFCGLFALLAEVTQLFPHPNNQSMSTLIPLTQRIFLSTIATVIIAENLNAYLVAKLKIFFNGRHIGTRFIFSTLISTFISMLVFSLIGFYGRLPNEGFILLTLTSWLYRFITELALIPVSIAISKKLKQIEKTDIYDRNTNFNIFAFDSHYSSTEDHLFNKEAK
ncbi:MAG: hypothetical protein COV52_03350 [Gammaproteobacteria bacterium CG11_big_fil_rev_8_21_14_0_20_46_22]|nr:MAG: hypothetical protein COW05_00750 [Gammaproteobacteria bacterium CG12_big_fil_rev_8_21_14_0_65_46_12]PIR11578.1 MAG: hypothetical protein COV52_03350 [Gammaproteobacteria bacterium CG11_big_fil_rev_8_21_14_0_20_46_22]